MKFLRQKKSLNLRCRTGRRGFSLIEIVIASTIMTVFFVSILSTYTLFLQTLSHGTKQIKAAYLMRGSLEAVRLLRDDNFPANIATLSNDTDYYLSWGGSKWTLTTSPNYIDGFERKIFLAPVYRDGNDDLADSGTLDPSARYVTSEVSWWNGSATTTESIKTLITNINND